MSWVCSDVCIYFHYSQEHRSRALPSLRTLAHGFVRQMWEERCASGSNLQAACGRDFIFLSGWGTLATVLGPCNLCWSDKPPCFSIIPVEAFRKHLGYSAPKWLPLLLEEVWSARVLLQSSLGSQALAHSSVEVHNDGPGGMVFLTGDCRVQSNALSCVGHCDPRASGIGLCSDATQKPVGWALRNVCVFSFQAWEDNADEARWKIDCLWL